MKIYKLIRGWVRHRIWHTCPECNSDAPACDTCEICYNHDYYRHPWDNLRQRNAVISYQWVKFKATLNKKHEK